jgi:signal transduction histidine kinase/ActR/RegA family two-component response regulator
MTEKMNRHPEHQSDKLQARIEYLEESRRITQNALEMALSLADFQENISKNYDPNSLLREAEKRIRQIIPFQANALYLVDQTSSDFKLSICTPAEMQPEIENEIERMIDRGFFAWAIRERRGITISSTDHSKSFVLHVIATHSRIRGMFIGLLPDPQRVVPDTFFTLLSIILLNTANALESIEFYQYLRDQSAVLERKIQERTAALAHSERQLQQVLKIQAIGTLAGGIAHDFNNILFPIVGYTELTMDELPESSQARKNLAEVLQAANRAKELVQQILTFSRQSCQERKPIRVQYIIKETLKLLRASIPKTIEIEHQLDENCGAIMGDPTQIHQVVMNLCTNAYQAMQENGGKLSLELKEINLDYDDMLEKIGVQPGKHLCLTVKDEGHGMDPSVMARIFEPYYTTKEQGKGTGLGLSVIHGIVKNHGGEIIVESHRDEGSTFHVYLPVLDDVDITIEHPECAVETQGQERILLVDDEVQIAFMEQKILERLGYSVTAKTSSKEALQIFSEQPDNFDLVITDMTMPQMTGDKLAQELMRIKPDIPVILCTGFNEMITEEKALQLGIDKFVMKPVVKDELAATIRSVLDKDHGRPPACIPSSSLCVSDHSTSAGN